MLILQGVDGLGHRLGILIFVGGRGFGDRYGGVHSMKGGRVLGQTLGMLIL